MGILEAGWNPLGIPLIVRGGASRAEIATMPLRDHFRPPVSKKASWEGFHGGWPMTMVQQLSRVLPPEFSAEPRVHLGAYFEIDVCAYEEDGHAGGASAKEAEGAVATATWAPPKPTATVQADLSEQYEYEVLVYDHGRGRVLVAAVEIVSPANKDRRENRRAFVARCAALLQQRVCVSTVDVVTTRRFNLFADLMKLIGKKDRLFGPKPPPIYAVTCRGKKVRESPLLEIWAYPLQVGKKLPTLPVWLDDDRAVSLDLESSYKETCRALRIR
jgi:hypothetical protein